MKLSVIVCTRNRAYAITSCLDSIAQSLAHAAPVDAEIVVVDNGSTDDTSARVREWASSRAIPVNLQLEPRKGISVARNCGIRAAHGDLLVWTDDDCRLDINHISVALRRDAADAEPVLRGGRVELGDPTDLPLSIRIGDKAQRWQKGTYPTIGGSVAGAFIGANMTMRRTIVDKLGFFDERFGGGCPIPGGEETDYIFRAYFAGIIIEYVPDMIVYHYHGRKSAAVGKKLISNYSISTGALYIKFFLKDPNLARHFYWFGKSAIRDMVSGKNTCMPDFDFSHTDKVFYHTLGAVRFCAASIKRSTARLLS